MMQNVCTHNALRLHLWRCPGVQHATSRARQRAPPTRALLPQPLSTIVDGAAVLAAVGSIGLSALPILTGEAAKVNARRPVDSDVEEEDFAFGVMSGVSLLPYANWTAWVLRAFEQQRDAALYYAVAAAYALPWLTHDLRLDSFTAAMLLLGAANVQVERVAATEEAEWTVPGLSQLASNLSRSIVTPTRQVASAAQRKQLAAERRQPPPGEDAEKRDADLAQLEQKELQRWDEALKSRDASRDRSP